jgi:hypothetical protein
MSIRKPSAGDTIGARCTRCREIRNHTIVAMVGEKVVRVECNTCGGVHNYKPAAEAKPAAPRKGPSAKAAPAPGKGARGRAGSEQREWEALRPTLQPEKALPYAMDAAFKVGDLVRHPVFGLGVVQSLGASKAEILFESGRKLLRCR